MQAWEKSQSPRSEVCCRYEGLSVILDRWDHALVLLLRRLGIGAGEGPIRSRMNLIRTPTELTARPPWSELDALPQVVEKTATGAVAKLLKTPNIDWDKQMLIVVTAGSKPTGGWKVNIDSVKVLRSALRFGRGGIHETSGSLCLDAGERPNSWNDVRHSRGSEVALLANDGVLSTQAAKDSGVS